MRRDHTSGKSDPYQKAVFCGDGVKHAGTEAIADSHPLAAFWVIAGEIHFGPNKGCLTERAEEAQSSKTD
jgi:hypothetical protein